MGFRAKASDRASLVEALERAGLAVRRRGKEQPIVQDPASDERICMKERLYDQGATHDAELYRATTEPPTTQSADIEALTTSELSKLGVSLRIESGVALTSMRNAILGSIETTTRPLSRDVVRPRGIGLWCWVMLVVIWATIAMFMALSVRRWVSPEPIRLALHQTFTCAGRTYVMLPERIEAVTCRQGARPARCMAFPGLKPLPADAPSRITSRVTSHRAHASGCKDDRIDQVDCLLP